MFSDACILTIKGLWLCGTKCIWFEIQLWVFRKNALLWESMSKQDLIRSYNLLQLNFRKSFKSLGSREISFCITVFFGVKGWMYDAWRAHQPQYTGGATSHISQELLRNSYSINLPLYHSWIRYLMYPIFGASVQFTR